MVGRIDEREEETKVIICSADQTNQDDAIASLACISFHVIHPAKRVSLLIST